MRRTLLVQDEPSSTAANELSDKAGKLENDGLCGVGLVCSSSLDLNYRQQEWTAKYPNLYSTEWRFFAPT